MARSHESVLIDLTDGAVDPLPAASPEGIWGPRAMLVAIDIAMVMTAWIVALAGPWGNLDGTMLAPTLAVGLACTCVAGLGVGRRESLRVGAIRALEVQRILQASLSSGVTFFVVWTVMGAPVPYLQLVLGVALAGVLLNVGRGYVRWWVTQQRAVGELQEHVIVIGDGEDAAHVVRLLAEHPEQGLRVVGTLGGEPPPGAAHLYGGPASRALSWAAHTGATQVLIIPTALSHTELNQLTRDLLAAGLQVHLWTGLSGVHHTRLRRGAIARQPMFSVELAHPSRPQLAAKRMIDVVVATLLLVIAAPVLAVAAAAVRLTSGPGVLFRQVRVGRDGEPFELLKLRSMVVDAERVRGQLVADNERLDGPLFKLDCDPRVTPVGRFLRASSIDELPQLINVLRGEMSLIGPRPALPEEDAQFDDLLRTRTRMLPGISGLWQIEGRDNPHFGVYRRLDLFYIENWSLMLDIGILFATAGLVVLRGLKAVSPKPTAGGAVSQPVTS